jgi:hypothetical protein
LLSTAAKGRQSRTRGLAGFRKAEVARATLGGMPLEVVLPLPRPLEPVRHLRSTLLRSSIESVRSRGRFDDYERALAPAHKETLLRAVAATWIAVDAANAHYAACDALGLSPEQQVLAGRGTFDGARDTLMGTALGPRPVGVTRGSWRLTPP